MPDEDGRTTAPELRDEVERRLGPVEDAVGRGEAVEAALSAACADRPELLPHLRRAWDALCEIELRVRRLAGSSRDLETPRLSDPPPARPLPVIPGYELEAEIGRGGLAIVYRARQVKTPRRVCAVKIPLAGAHATEAERRRFWYEVEAAAELSHPNIVPIFEVGDASDPTATPFFSMAWLDRGSLADRLGAGPVPVRTAAEWITQVAAAIAHAHDHGILHRDLKPSNILLDAEGRPCVADFGLAGRMDRLGELTRSGSALGTPAYMAPEQANRRRGQITFAADVYGLGATLYALLTGRPPVSGEDDSERLRSLLDEPATPPSQLNPAVDRDLETICLKCLEKDPGRRYGSARALADDLRCWLAGEPIQARPPGRTEQLRRWVRRHKFASVVAAAAAVVVAWGVFGFFAMRRERNRALAAERERAEQLWVSRLDRARAGRWSQRAGRRFDGLSALADAAGLGVYADRRRELRDEAIACLTLPDVHLDQNSLWPAPGPLVVGHDVDPDFVLTASSDRDGAITVRRLADGAPVATLPGTGSEAWVVRFAPGRGHLAAIYRRDGLFRVWNLATGRPVEDLPAAISGIAFDFAPDGRQLAIGRRDGTIGIHDLAGGAPRVLGRDIAPDSLAIAPDGRRLAVASRRTQDRSQAVQVRDWETGAVVRALPHPTEVLALAWRPDGARLAAAGGDGVVYEWETGRGATSREPVSLRRGHQVAVSGVAYSRAGDLISSVGWDNLVLLWGASQDRPLVAGTGGPWLRFGPGDRRLAGAVVEAHARVGLWEIAPGHECRTLLGHEGTGPWFVAFSPDGRLLASASIDGVRLWNGRTGQALALLPSGPCGSALFQPDGTGLLTSGGAGLLLWPIERDHDSLRIAAPRDLGVFSEYFQSHMALDRSGRWLGVVKSRYDGGTGGAHRGRAVVLRLDRPAERWSIEDEAGIESIAISPDGRWVATGSWHGEATLVWERPARPGKLTARTAAFRLPSGDALVAFSPDSARLDVGSVSGYSSWTVGSWKPAPPLVDPPGARLRGPLAHTADGILLAITRNGRSVTLVETATGTVLATLEPPEPRLISWMTFNPTGDRLAVATQTGAVLLWDLGLVRRELRSVGLDWSGTDSLAPAPSPITVSVDAGPRRATFAELARRGRWSELVPRLDEAIAREPDEWLLYVRRGRARAETGQWDRAAEDFAQARALAGQAAGLANWVDRAMIELVRGDAAAHRRVCEDMLREFAGTPNATIANDVAWLCCISPGGPAAEALELADHAVRSAPGNSTLLNTKGAALIRAGRPDEAIPILRETIGRSDEGGNVWDWLLLSIACRASGRTDEADEALGRVEEHAERIRGLRQNDQGEARVSWIEWQSLRQLYREATGRSLPDQGESVASPGGQPGKPPM